MDRFLKILFFALVVKPVVLIVLGLNIRGRQNLPTTGGSIVAANHNSHLDALVLMSLFKLSQIHRIRPVAAADYFMSNRYLSWFSRVCMGIIPLERKAARFRLEDFDVCHAALDAGDILIIFPEGSRGDPEEMSTIKRGLYHLIHARENAPITPVVLHGLGRALPRGTALLVPFNCDVIIGEPMEEVSDSHAFVEEISTTFDKLLKQCITRTKWEE